MLLSEDGKDACVLPCLRKGMNDASEEGVTELVYSALGGCFYSSCIDRRVQYPPVSVVD
jgi:hypothetical protein